MELTIKNPHGVHIKYNVSYSLGDIVKINDSYHCLSNSAITNVFGVKNPSMYPITMKGILRKDFPDTKNDDNEWKIIEIKSFYLSSFIILLINRQKQYLVMAQPSDCRDVLRLIRKGKERKETLEIQSKY